ncbi:hypothetical protein AAKU64_001981 [Undibacterium sp. GrIS 1.8]
MDVASAVSSDVYLDISAIKAGLLLIAINLKRMIENINQFGKLIVPFYLIVNCYSVLGLLLF